MKITEKNWDTVRSLFRKSMITSNHFAFATVDRHGVPHVSPIGTLFLRDNMTGFYFDEFPVKMTDNLDYNNRVCILAVNSGKWFWLSSLIRGRFATPPSVRISGTIGEKRKATDDELIKIKKLFRPLKLFRGYTLLWSKLSHVRDIHFDSIEPVTTGKMSYTF